jgi:hypothetical protein
MNARKIIVITILFLLLVIIAGANQVNITEKDYLTQLSSENETEREAASQNISNGRKNTISQLENIVKNYIKDEKRRGTTKTSIVLLGKFRSAESVPLLAENITFGVFYKETKRTQSPEDYYPCVGALIEIGTPAIPAMLTNIKNKDDATIRELSARVIRYVEGIDVGRYILENAIKQAGSQEKARLQKALELDFFKLPTTEINKPKN